MTRHALQLTFFPIEARTWTTVPFAASKASCGFPSPAEGDMDRPLDFNELLVVHPAATFAVEIEGESMTGAGLFPGDIAVVDRSLSPFDKCVVLAIIDGGFTIKRYRLKAGRVILQAENPAFRDLVIGEGCAFEVWGVIRHAIRKL